MSKTKNRAPRRQMPELHRSLRQTFGIERLRSGQDDVIGSVLEGTDTLAIMPTGEGKSLCYQLPALHLEGTTIIVSPLISLMKDQVDKLQDHGLDSDSDQEKLKRMEAYARSAPCRWRLLHGYFEEEMPRERCDTCDNCRRGLAQLAERPITDLGSTPKQNGIADTETELDIGDQVSLPRYGSGRVEEIDDDALVVSFPDDKNRKFKREFARRISRSRQKM